VKDFDLRMDVVDLVLQKRLDEKAVVSQRVDVDLFRRG